MTAAPLPLLGTFHEISFTVPDVRAALEFYERLGFIQATTTDAFTHPYAVLTDGRLFIGLHQRSGAAAALTFVRPGIAASLGAFAAAGIELTRCRTGDEEFNQVEFTDPFGHTVAVLEARTYSPVARAAGAASLCGDFAEISLPAPDFAVAQAFWEPLGFVAAEETAVPHPHLTLTSDHLDLAFHAPGVCGQPMLVFRDSALPQRLARLEQLGLPLRRAADGNGAHIYSPDGTPLLLLEEAL